MRINLAKLEDIPKMQYIHKVFKEVGGPIFKYYIFSDYFKLHISKKTCFVIKEDNNIIGVLCLKKKKWYCEIESLAVQKRMRKKGVGKKLLNYTIKWCKNNSFKKIKLWSYKYFDARNFYLKNGFDELPFSYISNSYVFKKELDI